MLGQVLGYSDQTRMGDISGDDGKRYRFSMSEWKSEDFPSRGTRVDFAVVDGEARSVYIAMEHGEPYWPRSSSNSKDKVIAGLLAIFLGSLGIHKFYLGFTTPGLIMLLTSTIGWVITIFMLGLPNIVLGIIAFIEGIIYLTKSDEEFHRIYVVEQKQWF